MTGVMRYAVLAVMALVVLVLTPGAAWAQTTVTTEPTTSFDKNSANVCGQWTSDQPGFNEFEYGTDTTYGSVVGSAATDNGVTSGTNCITFTGLTPATTYHYRFVFLLPQSGSFCPCTEYDGNDEAVTTEAGSAPQIPGPTTATPYSTNDGFSISTAVNAEGYPTTWQVDYGSGPTSLNNSTTPQSVLVWPDDSELVYADVPPSGTLATNQVYYWQIVATNTLGTTMSTIGSVTLGSLTSTLSVSTTGGTGSGTVTSSPGGINCGTTCSQSFATATSVTLTPTPAPGSYFSGWGGACSGVSTCTLDMSHDLSATANFDLEPLAPPPTSHTMTVDFSGDGSGTVTSTPGGIDCASNCFSPFNSGTQLTLTAVAAAGSKFTGWSGGRCSGTESCVVTLSSDQTVTATFTKAPAPPPSTRPAPSLAGKTLAAAEHAIKAARFKVGTVKKAFSSKVKKDRVISQKPKPHSRLKKGTKINLVISKGKHR